MGEEGEGCTLSLGVLTQARNCLHEQTQAKGLFGALPANSHLLAMGGVGRADGIQGVLWIRLASAAVLEAEPFPGRIWQEQ